MTGSKDTQINKYVISFFDAWTRLDENPDADDAEALASAWQLRDAIAADRESAIGDADG